MKIKSVSGVTCYSKNLDKTVEFYEALGFVTRKRDENHAAVYSNWFWIDFIAHDKEQRENFENDAQSNYKGTGMIIYLSVDNVDTWYTGLIEKGFTPLSEPQNSPWGNREFMIHDPDGYKLAIFKRK